MKIIEGIFTKNPKAYKRDQAVKRDLRDIMALLFQRHLYREGKTSDLPLQR